jgi:hypothetical protein
MSIILENATEAQGANMTLLGRTNLLALKTFGIISGVTMPGPIV